MPEFTDILYEKNHRVRGAAWITISRPDVMNAFTGHTLTEMRDAVEAASGDPEVGVIVITGAGDRAFCAGGDVRWLQEIQREGAASAAPVDPHAGIEDCLKPVIARVNGYSVVGAKKAKEIWMLCRRYSAQEALDMGLVNAVVPHDKLDEEVDRWCEELLAKSPSCLKILKASFRTLYQPLREASRRDWVAEIAPEFYRSGEADEGKNAFLERRE